MSTVVSAPTTLARGFDVWSPLAADIVEAAVADGYTFCARYVDNLSAGEVKTILTGGLALILLQKAPATGGYSPTSNGTTSGQRAAAQAQKLGIPVGACLFSDLEDTSGNTSSDVLAYSNNWAHAVTAAGYAAGLYVGTSMFTDRQLYESFSYQHYWMAGVAGLPFVYSRGYQLYQSGQATIGGSNGSNGLKVDLDFAYTDLRGGTLSWVVG